MAVTFRIPSVFLTRTGGRQTVQTSAGTLQSALDQLSEEHPQLVETLLSRGELSRFVNLYVDGENVRHTGSLATSLPDGAEVLVIPAVAGG